MLSLNTLISQPPWPWTQLHPTSLTRFGSSKSTILSWQGTGIMHTVSMLTTKCWWMTFVTSWCRKEKLYVPRCFTKTIVWEYHDTHSHFSQPHMQNMISEQLYWLKITHNTVRVLKKLQFTYQHFKSDTQKVAGLYAPLPVPNSHGSIFISTLYASCWRMKDTQ